MHQNVATLDVLQLINPSSRLFALLRRFASHKQVEIEIVARYNVSPHFPTITCFDSHFEFRAVNGAVIQVPHINDSSNDCPEFISSEFVLWLRDIAGLKFDAPSGDAAHSSRDLSPVKRFFPDTASPDVEVRDVTAEMEALDRPLNDFTPSKILAYACFDPTVLASGFATKVPKLLEAFPFLQVTLANLIAYATASLDFSIPKYAWCTSYATHVASALGLSVKKTASASLLARQTTLAASPQVEAPWPSPPIWPFIRRYVFRTPRRDVESDSPFSLHQANVDYTSYPVPLVSQYTAPGYMEQWFSSSKTQEGYKRQLAFKVPWDLDAAPSLLSLPSVFDKWTIKQWYNGRGVTRVASVCNVAWDSASVPTGLINFPRPCFFVFDGDAAVQTHSGCVLAYARQSNLGYGVGSMYKELMSYVQKTFRMKTFLLPSVIPDMPYSSLSIEGNFRVNGEGMFAIVVRGAPTPFVRVV